MTGKRGHYLTKNRVFSKTKVVRSAGIQPRKIANRILSTIRKEEDAHLRLNSKYGQLKKETIERLNKSTSKAIQREGERRKIEKEIDEILKEKGAHPSSVSKLRNEIIRQIQKDEKRKRKMEFHKEELETEEREAKWVKKRMEKE